MYTSVVINGKVVPLDPQHVIGRGGEGEVYNIGQGRALKIFLPPDAPDFTDKPFLQVAAEKRIAEHQLKLPNFPNGLPNEVVGPFDLALEYPSRIKKVVGYDMELLIGWEVLMQYGTKTFREAGISNSKVVAIFKNLHRVLTGLQSKQVVIGDFNDLGVLVKEEDIRLVDANSFQWGTYKCAVYTARFVDPLLCDPNDTRPVLIKPHNHLSDWYAYNVMLMQSLLYVDPYGGVYNGKKAGKKAVHTQRPLLRITVFNPYVTYPGIAIPYHVLSDDLLDHFHKVFEKDLRIEFPLNLLDSLHWVKCSLCGVEHSRRTCPNCLTIAPVMVPSTQTVRGKVKFSKIFSIPLGTIVYVTFQGGKLHYIYYENSAFKREDRSIIVSLALNPHMRYRIKGDSTVIGVNDRMVTVTPNKPHDIKTVDAFNTGMHPMFDTNANARFWIENGNLMKDGPYGPEFIGNVLSNQTLFWVGNSLGFGFYRAGNISIAFIFNPNRPGINDSVKLPQITGQIIDADCLFSSKQCWLMLSVIEGSQRVNRCMVYNEDGTMAAEAFAIDGDGSWLETIKGKVVVSNALFASTDNGIVRVEVVNGQLVVTREYPDTAAPFVDSGVHLVASPQGLYVIRRNEIGLLQITP